MNLGRNDTRLMYCTRYTHSTANGGTDHSLH